MPKPALRPELAPILALIGERPDEALADAIADASSTAGCGRLPDYTTALGVSKDLAGVIRSAASAILLRQTLEMSAEEALVLAVLPEGLAFLEVTVAECEGRRNIVPFPHVNPFTGERRTR